MARVHTRTQRSGAEVRQCALHSFNKLEEPEESSPLLFWWLCREGASVSIAKAGNYHTSEKKLPS